MSSSLDIVDYQLNVFIALNTGRGFFLFRLRSVKANIGVHESEFNTGSAEWDRFSAIFYCKPV